MIISCSAPKARRSVCRPPPQMHNHGNYLISLGNLVRWLGAQAEELGVEIFPGFAAAEVLYDEVGAVRGIATGDMGIGRDGQPTANHTPGVELLAPPDFFRRRLPGILDQNLVRSLFLAEGLRSADLWPRRQGIVGDRSGQAQGRPARPYGRLAFGQRNLRRLLPLSSGRAIRSRSASSSGSTIRIPICRPSRNCSVSRPTRRSGPPLQGGAGSPMAPAPLSEGGFQSIPKLTFPGGLLIGDTAGFLNTPKIKGIHTAMKSGMVAAEALFAQFGDESKASQREISGYPERLKGFLAVAGALRRPQYSSGVSSRALGRTGLCGHRYLCLPWSRPPGRCRCMPTTTNCAKPRPRPPIAYPKPDGKLTFDRLVLGVHLECDP